MTINNTDVVTAAILKDNLLTVVLNNVDTFSIDSTHMNFTEIKARVFSKDQDWSDLRDLMDVSAAIEEYADGRVTIQDGVVEYCGEPVHSSLTYRIFKMKEEGHDITPLTNFIDNLMDNPSKRAVDELYGFLEYGNLPLTLDGCFLAYKVVNSDYKDKYSRTFDNTIVAQPMMPRNRVNDNKEVTCSQGLHFCSREYAEGFFGYSGDHMMVIKINPADVVSIPVDYNNTKGRCCSYEVVGEIGFNGAKVATKDRLEEGSSVNTTYTQEEVDAIEEEARAEGYDEGYDNARYQFDRECW